MAITYYKRFRMEIDLDGSLHVPPLPRDLEWRAWDDSLIERHAEVKYQCFHREVDADVFPCLGEPQGCLRLMREIRRKAGFLPSATWLLTGPRGDLGMIQGVIDRGPIGAIQNIGVIPEVRGGGLGRALVLKCLDGFHRAGLKRVYLEVTAENNAAVRLYRAVGFRKAKTLYKAVDHPEIRYTE